MFDSIFWGPVIGLPLLVVMINGSIRFFANEPQAAASEVVAMLVVLDASAAVDPHPFMRFVVTAVPNAVPMFTFVVSIILCCAVWFFCMYKLEPMILHNHIHGSGSAGFPLGQWLFAWSASMILFVLNVAVFSGRVVAI